MSKRNKIGEMFVDRNGKTSAKRVGAFIGVMAALVMGFIQIADCCEQDNTGMIISIFTGSLGLLASSMAEKQNNDYTKGQKSIDA